MNWYSMGRLFESPKWWTPSWRGRWKVVQPPTQDVFGEWFIRADQISREGGAGKMRKNSVIHLKCLTTEGFKR